MDTTNQNNATRFPSNIAKMFQSRNPFRSVTKFLKSPVTQFLFKFLTKSALRFLGNTAKKSLNSTLYRYLRKTASKYLRKSALKFPFRSRSRFLSKCRRRSVDITKQSMPNCTWTLLSQSKNKLSPAVTTKLSDHQF